MRSPAPRAPGLFDALAPLVTDASGRRRDGSATDAIDALDDDPFDDRLAEVAAQRFAADDRASGDARSGLLRAVAELAETHAVAADLACETAAIDLPLDVPDPSPANGDAGPLLVVPDVIRTCRDRLALHATAEDRQRMDGVAALFDHVLADDRIPTGVRNTLARLQLPVLRIALADEAFFASRSHPTTRLLDRLTAAAVGWRDDSPSSRAGIAALERTVHRAIRGSFEDPAQHVRLLGQFERAVADIASLAPAEPPPPPDEEDRDILVIKTTIQISQLLAGIEVDRAIRFFLLDVWSRVLVEIACREPDAGRDALLARAKRLCFDLAWTTAPKTTSGERARLAGLLPTMVAAIRDGLRVIDFAADAERAFFADWVRALLTAVRGTPGSPFRANDAGHEGITIDAFAQRLRDGSFGPESVLELAAPVPGLAGGEKTVPLPPAPPAPPPLVVDEMKKGEWFELRVPESNRPVRMRLSWVSPLRSFYLLISGDGSLTRSLDPPTLRALVESGDLKRATGRRDD